MVRPRKPGGGTSGGARVSTTAAAPTMREEMKGALSGVSFGPSLVKSATPNLRHAQSLFHQRIAPLSDSCLPLPNPNSGSMVPRHEARLNTPGLESHAVRRFIWPTAFSPATRNWFSSRHGFGQLIERSINWARCLDNQPRA